MLALLNLTTLLLRCTLAFFRGRRAVSRALGCGTREDTGQGDESGVRRRPIISRPTRRLYSSGGCGRARDACKAETCLPGIFDPLCILRVSMQERVPTHRQVSGSEAMGFLKFAGGIVGVIILCIGGVLIAARFADGPWEIIAGGPFTSGEKSVFASRCAVLQGCLCGGTCLSILSRQSRRLHTPHTPPARDQPHAELLSYQSCCSSRLARFAPTRRAQENIVNEAKDRPRSLTPLKLHRQDWMTPARATSASRKI